MGPARQKLGISSNFDETAPHRGVETATSKRAAMAIRFPLRDFAPGTLHCHEIPGGLQCDHPGWREVLGVSSVARIQAGVEVPADEVALGVAAMKA